MEWKEVLAIVSRWLHVGTAIVVLGGSVFMRYVLIPAAERLAPETHESLRAGIGNIWKRFVHAGIALFLLSGFYNYLVVMMPLHKGDGLYHGLLGTKILLALVIFFLASALVGRSAAFETMRQNRKTWLGLIVLPGFVIVAISGYLKIRGVPAPRPVVVDARQGTFSCAAAEHRTSASLGCSPARGEVGRPRCRWACGGSRGQIGGTC